jgi:hypothetical protein
VAPTSLRLSLACPEIGLSARGSIDGAIASLIFDGGATREIELFHCKRDGTACFAHVEQLTGIDAGSNGDVRGRPGDIFAFGGDPELSGRERVGQLVLVYAEDNLFVEPLDQGLVPRRYKRVGTVDDVDQLARLGDAVWLGGGHRIDISIEQR